MIRRYVAGERKRYCNPLTYLFLCAALSLLVWTLVSDAFVPQMRASIAAQGRELVGLSPAQKERLLELQLGSVTYSAQIGLVLCLPLAAMLRLLFRKTGYNFAEVLVFTLFASGQVYLAYALLTLAVFPLSHSFLLNSALTLLLYAVIYCQAARGFFGRGFGTFVKVMVAFAVSLFVYQETQSHLLRAWVLLTT
jgi:hypothetical protein